MCKICKENPGVVITVEDAVPKMFQKVKEVLAVSKDPGVSSETAILASLPITTLIALRAHMPEDLNQSPTARVLAANARIKSFVFLELPAELRNHIYGYLLEHGLPINVTMPKAKNGRRPSRFKYYWPGLKGSPLLMSCKQVHEECQQYMWGHNKLKSDDASTFQFLPQA